MLAGGSGKIFPGFMIPSGVERSFTRCILEVVRRWKTHGMNALSPAR